jgi:hypothetical protein
VVQEHKTLVAMCSTFSSETGVEVVDTDHPLSLRRERVAEMRSEKARATGYEGGAYDESGAVMSSTRIVLGLPCVRLRRHDRLCQRAIGEGAVNPAARGGPLAQC